MLGSGAIVNGNIEGVQTLFIGGTAPVFVDGNFFNSTNELIVGAGATVDFNGNVTGNRLDIDVGGSVTINGNLTFTDSGSLTIGQGSSLTVTGNIEPCPSGFTASVDGTITVEGDNLCAALSGLGGLP